MAKNKKKKNFVLSEAIKAKEAKDQAAKDKLNKVTKPDVKEKDKKIPDTHTKEGVLLKLKRADFPYSRNGIIAYCDYRVEYWQLKKTEMLKKTDPNIKLKIKRDKLIASLKEINEKLNIEGDEVETETKNN